MTAGIVDDGRQFEIRALDVARAKHSPDGSQGSQMYNGREHDGVFVDHQSINAYEFTVDRSKAKALKDAGKIADILNHLLSDPAHRYKSATGFFVTQQEPTAEQRQAVEGAAKKSGVTIKAMSYLTLQRTLVDVEGYLRHRDQAPFGSTSFQDASGSKQKAKEKYVNPTLRQRGATSTLEFGDLVRGVNEGGKIALIGDYGIGKSAALRQLYVLLRKAYLKNPTNNPFPMHINLRDCVGLRTASEIIRRHADEIGFDGSHGLVSAWRAGRVALLLDGFDELIPVRWIGVPRDLKTVRWQALDVVRRIIGETPDSSAVVVSGRPQYFSSDSELKETLGMSSASTLELLDFDDEQIREFLGGENRMPDWLPPRPLLIQFLSQGAFDFDADPLDEERGSGWTRILELVSSRESERVTSIPSSTFLQLLARVAFKARFEAGTRHSVTISSMREAFYEVCGYEAEEEGVQVLMRLPGLSADSGGTSGKDTRVFIDQDFADAAFGLELSSYVESPYQGHPLCDAAPWTAASSPVSIEVAVHRLVASEMRAGAVVAALQKRSADHFNDAVLLDLIQMADVAGASVIKERFFVTDAFVPILALSDGPSFLGQTTFKGCAIECLDVADASDVSGAPQFVDTMFGSVLGWSSLPSDAVSRFVECDFGSFVGVGRTTAAYMALGIPPIHRVALSILKKIYDQAGSARVVSSLPRGLPLEDRVLVSAALDVLVASELVYRASGKGAELVHTVRGARGRAMRYLESPPSISEIFT